MKHMMIDGVTCAFDNERNVLEVAQKYGFDIPSLCYCENLSIYGGCRMCVVDSGARSLQAACVLPAANGMKVKTNTPEIREYRRNILELLLSTHEKKCLSCVRSQNCELQALCKELGVENGDKFEGFKVNYTIDDLSPSIVRDAANHHSFQMTSHYAHTTVQQRRDALNRLTWN